MRMVAIIAAMLVLVPATGIAQEKEIIRMPGMLEGLPFSTAVRVGDMIYLSGQIGTLPNSRQLAAGGVAGETRQTLENIKSVLEFAGSSMDRVVKCTVFLLNIEDYAAVNEVYATYFTVDPPARSAMAASGLALGSQVEIECIALAGR